MSDAPLTVSDPYLPISEQPLQGKRILVTRTREQASTLSQRLQTLGAQPVEFPTIRIVPPAQWDQLDAALLRLYSKNRTEGYDWLVLTSTNGVHICMRRLIELGYQPAELQSIYKIRIATIGPATAIALQQYNLHSDLVPDEYIAEGLTRALLQDAQTRQQPLAGQRILLARASEARKVLLTDLRQAGAYVDEVAAYFTEAVGRDDPNGTQVLQLLQTGQLNMLTFTSSSTVRNFIAWLQSCEQEDAKSLLTTVQQKTHIASIGPITSQTARDHGLRVDCEAKEFTINGLVDAIIAYYSTISSI
jgi:uroporphyrinogen-III synthase